MRPPTRITRRDRGRIGIQGARSNLRTLKTPIAIVEARSRTRPMMIVAVPANLRKSSSRRWAGAGSVAGATGSVLALLVPSAAGASPPMAENANGRRSLERCDAVRDPPLPWAARPKGFIEPASSNGPRPGGLAVYDPGLSSRVLGVESRPGRPPWRKIEAMDRGFRMARIAIDCPSMRRTKRSFSPFPFFAERVQVRTDPYSSVDDYKS